MSLSSTYDDDLHHVIVYLPETDMTGCEEYSKEIPLYLDCRYITPGDLSYCLFESTKFTSGIGYTQTFKKLNSNVFVDVLHYGGSIYITEPYAPFGRFKSSDMKKHYYIPKEGNKEKQTQSNT